MVIIILHTVLGTDKRPHHRDLFKRQGLPFVSYCHPHARGDSAVLPVVAGTKNLLGVRAARHTQRCLQVHALSALGRLSSLSLRNNPLGRGCSFGPPPGVAFPRLARLYLDGCGITRMGTLLLEHLTGATPPLINGV